MQKPKVSIGTVFPAGKVVSIRKDGAILETPSGDKFFSQQQIERFINDERSIQQA